MSEVRSAADTCFETNPNVSPNLKLFSNAGGEMGSSHELSYEESYHLDYTVEEARIILNTPLTMNHQNDSLSMFMCHDKNGNRHVREGATGPLALVPFQSAATAL